ncbi:uncharacterized protein OCT59_006109 [Rhizophagus irregularis]|uniref:uncharacterized protein n=1 Tax=Rhizophagus irregularis TaxID=588596 RepID=UPI00331FB0DB|nr:hypothetical protein OCT59_006109 [Rhizophagus irregularis]
MENPNFNIQDFEAICVTKWIGGHGITIGEYLMEANFHGIMKDSNFTNPSPDCHGLIYWDTFGYNAFTIKARSEIMRNIDEPCQNPIESFLLIQGDANVGAALIDALQLTR